MGKSLLIVESPAKAKTIEKYLGSDFVVKSSIGHIRDLPKSGMSIDIDNGFAPTYEINKDKKKTVTELKKLAKEAEMVWLATDEDREGEAIAWHLVEALNLSKKPTKRIVFHEITEPAIKAAVKNPRELDTKLVDAQQARRILDRLVGYELSPVLWKKVQYGLSAGRVQSVSVRILAEREREIQDFVPEASYKVNSILKNSLGNSFKATLPTNLKTLDEAKSFLNDVKSSELSVDDLTKKPSIRKPAAPFTTSTLQQEANRKLGFSAKQTMSTAQKLYETGKITYMRTDSVNLSEIALDAAGKMISAEYGSEFHKERRYSNKSANAQEAHEAIRPTDLNVSEVSGDSGQARLYDLIWKRTIASQMANAELERTNVKIGISNSDKKLSASGEVIKFEGFLKVYLESKDEDDDSEDSSILPPLKVGERVDLQNMTAKETFSRPPARYSEASIVKKLEELGIGRPSTYAPTISTIIDRQYVVKEDRDGKPRDYKILTLSNSEIKEELKQEDFGVERKKLFPTDTGLVVNDFLVKYFPGVVDYQFTAKVEDEFDQISRGEKIWQEMISDFYWPFHDKIKESEDVKRSEAVGTREIGLDPKTGKRVFARIGRYGPMVILGDTDDEEEKPKFASVPKGKSIETITLEEALPLFELPRHVGDSPEGEKIETQIGRFGPYVKAGKTFVSITQEEIYTITLDEALEKVKAKREEQANKIIAEWPKEDISILNGRYGSYIKAGKKNVKIPKDKEPKELTLEDCQEIIKNAPEKKPRARKKK
jgi:DNA topoisomerase-1